jgi:hypothetical protein
LINESVSVESNDSLLTDLKLIKKIDILGRLTNTTKFNIEFYNDGSVMKKYIIK